MSKGQKDPTNNWPDGSTWVFQGTIAEDATAGTHVCTLTVSPGAGLEMLVQYGSITAGATATAQVASAFIDDGTNFIAAFIDNVSNTTSGARYNFPSTTGITITNGFVPSVGAMVSGTERLILKISTAAVSVTQTFAVMCRLRSPKLPSAVLLDTIGTSTNTINTNKIFG